MQGVIEGRVVHYVSDLAPQPERHLAATITGVVDENGTVNLDVHSDTATGLVRRTLVPFDEQTKPAGSWHWLERV